MTVGRRHTDGGLARTGRAVSLGRAGRAMTLVGALAGVAGAGYLAVTAVDVNTPSLLQNASARRADLGYAALALLVAPLTAIVARRRRPPGPVEGAGLAVVGLAFAALGTEAVVLSDRETLVPILPIAVYLPTAVILIGAGLIGAAHSSAALLGTMALFLGLSGVLAATLFVEEGDEAVVVTGLHDDWDQETAADHVFVDDAGNVWAVRPWNQAEPATLSLLDPGSGEFQAVAERRPGWPPTVLGSDATGTTWIVSSELDDPFQPVFETYREGRFSTVPSPASPLPPLDAVVLDQSRNRVLGLHSNFAVPAALVLEVFENGRWTTTPTPIVTESRAGALDMAVDANGAVWVWHDADPARVHRYDGRDWVPLPLGFDPETTTDLDFPPISLDAHRTFFTDPAGTVWLYDRDGSQLFVLDPTGAVVDQRPLPRTCAPLAFDTEARVWCSQSDGLSIVSPAGQVLYDSEDEGVHEFAAQSVAIGPDRAWLFVRRHESEQLLTFDYRAALADE